MQGLGGLPELHMKVKNNGLLQPISIMFIDFGPSFLLLWAVQVKPKASKPQTAWEAKTLIGATLYIYIYVYVFMCMYVFCIDALYTFVGHVRRNIEHLEFRAWSFTRGGGTLVRALVRGAVASAPG